VALDAVPERTVRVIPVLGFATLSKFDLAQRLLESIDYPVDKLVVVDNSGLKAWIPRPNDYVGELWTIRLPHGLGANGAWNLIIKSTPFAPYWVIPNDDSWFEPGALETIAHNVDPEKFNFVDVNPKWSCVVPGEGAIRTAGLWDEVFHPIYYDDDEYEWRMNMLGVEFNHIPAKVHHNNSSTLHSGYQDKNQHTFSRNQKMFRDKVQSNNTKEIGWSLDIRRNNAWD
jgi:GT2 family glycosyltransferase